MLEAKVGSQRKIPRARTLHPHLTSLVKGEENIGRRLTFPSIGGSG
jgi:hypothetical protein